MSKPHTNSEPSMEDILASIRKMIAEEPTGHRPVPDQMGRTPFGGDLAAEPEPDAWSSQAEPAAVDPNLATSFSSLSEALKSSPASNERRSLEDRIAGLVETEEPEARNALRPDGLSSFTARPAPSAGPLGGSSPRPTTPFGADEPHRSDPDDIAAAPASDLRNGSDQDHFSKLTDLGGTVPQRSDALSSARTSSPAKENGAPLPFGARPDPQRVISIPPRTGAPAGPGLNGTKPAPEAKNGSATNGSAAAFGQRPAGPSLSPVTRSLQERLKEKRPLEALGDETKSVSENSSGDIGALSPASLRSPLSPKPDATAKPDLGSFAPAAPVSPAAPVTPAPDTAAPATGAKPEAQPASPAANAMPSNALLDAVVNMVQNDPSSLSVFASGSAFIHGVGDKHDDPAPQALVPVPGQKLDGAASELLRPMLRQWLAENMPRIVEEALRSELSSSEAAEKDPKKS